jgi:anti-sigma factor RsiW
MTCRKLKKQLTLWLDGELKPEQAAEFKAWFDRCEEVRQCSECRKLIDEHNRFHSLISSIPKKEFPAFLHHRIIDEINRREPIYHKKEMRIRWQTVPATIAILLSLYVGSLIGIRTFNTQTTTVNESSELYTFGNNSLATDMNLSGGVE